MGKYLAGLVAIALVAAAAFFLVGGRDNDQTDTNTNQNQTSNSTTGSTKATSTDKVSISNFTFLPADITVKRGTAVTWTNNDSVTHNVSADSGNGPKSQNLANGETFSFTFNEAGTFNYICGLHPSMHGTVTVTE